METTGVLDIWSPPLCHPCDCSGMYTELEFQTATGVLEILTESRVHSLLKGFVAIVVPVAIRPPD